MKLRNKKLEQLTKEVLGEFYNNIEEFSKESPAIVEKLQIKERDPHVEQMIHAFALIQSSYNYYGEVLANKQVTSILFNILDMKLYPPCGKVHSKLTNEHNYIVGEGHIIKDQDNWFVVDTPSHINHINIKSKKVEIINGVFHFVITLEVNNSNFHSIDFFTHENVITSLFFKECSKEVIVYNNSQYNTKARARWVGPTTIQEALFFPEKFTHFTIENIDNVGIHKEFSIGIPMYKNMDIVPYDLTTNEILVKNMFFDTTNNVYFLEHQYEYTINVPNSEIIDIIKLYVVTEEGMVELPRATVSANGWYAIVQEDKMSVGFAHIDPTFLYFYCDVKLINRVIHHKQPEFEEYAPLHLSWHQYTHPVQRSIYECNIATATSLLKVSIENIANVIENIIISYDKFAAMSITLLNYEKAVHISTYGNFQVINNGYKVKLQAPKMKFLLFQAMMVEMRHKMQCFLHFIVETPEGIINDKTYQQD